MRLSKILFPAIALATLAFRPAHADGTNLTKSAISWVGILQTFPGSTKIVDGTKVYTEGTPLLTLRVKDRDGGNIFLSIPFTGKKAEAFYDLVKLAGQRELTFYYAEELKTSRTSCQNFAPEGCFELGSTSETSTLQYLTFEP